MDSLSLKFACGYTGTAVGTTANAELSSGLLTHVARCSVDGANQQLYVATLTIAASSTTTLDLTTGLANPLNESIASSLKFVKVKGVLIEHDPDSLATSGIAVFGGASNEFSGPWAAGDKATLVPGRWVGFGMPATDTGVTVDATHKNIALQNLGAGEATVNVMIHGTIT